jgi:Protein of unknown function (DUF2971)
MSRSLFHYQTLREDYLVTLLAKSIVRLSRPDAFNDPWDCRVHFSVPRDKQELRRMFQWLAARQNRKISPFTRRERRHRAHELKSRPAELQAKFLEMEQLMYRGLCKLYRVYCLSEIGDSPLMWAHYTASHTGICLEFDAHAVPFAHAAKVIYGATYPAYDITVTGYEPLITKSDVWAYEAEWRIVAEERTVAQALGTIKTDDGFLKLPPGVLKSIIIGCLAPEKSRELVADLVRTHAPDVSVRQATIASGSYDLVIP